MLLHANLCFSRKNASLIERNRAKNAVTNARVGAKFRDRRKKSDDTVRSADRGEASFLETAAFVSFLPGKEPFG